MATKLTTKKPGGEKPAAKKVARRIRRRRTARRRPPGPSPHRRPRRHPIRKAHFNAETAQVLRDADAGKNLLHYPSLEAMFDDLGI